MEKRSFSVSLPKNSLIAMKVIPGHFATVNSHVSHYLDMNEIKSNARVARDVAKELAMPYLASKLVDTIVCMEGTDAIGAYLAEELLLHGTNVMNSGRIIHIVTPTYNVDRKLVFRNNVREMIFNKNIVLLVASVSSGRTIDSVCECINYYGGKLVGISSLFSANPKNLKQEIHTLFTKDDIPGYQYNSQSEECALCKEGRKLDAIVSSEGYTSV